MNILFTVFVVISIVMTLYTAPSTMLTAMGVAGERAIGMSLSLCGIYAIWMGVLEVVAATPISDKLGRVLSPVVSRLFAREDELTKRHITMNISANILGLGSASTPLAISAISRMKSSGDRVARRGFATKNMVMLYVLNATSLQILPTTIISLRELAGSVDCASIIMPSLLASCIATVLGVMMVKIFVKD